MTCKKADVFDFYEYVFKDESVHADQMKKAKAVNFSDWRTYQMSDHLIMWAQFDVDKAESYFDDLLAAEAQADE